MWLAIVTGHPLRQPGLQHLLFNGLLTISHSPQYNWVPTGVNKQNGRKGRIIDTECKPFH